MSSRSETRRKGKGGDSRERLVDTTARLLRVQGYHATGLNQIVEESQAPKGSLYHYFPEGKEELACEAIALAGHSLQARLKSILASSKVGEAVDALCEISIAELLDSDYQDGCPVATVALESSGTCSTLQDACGSVLRESLSIIETWMVEKGLTPEQARTQAMGVLATYQGATLLCKVWRDPQPLRAAAAFIKASWPRPGGRDEAD